MRIQSLVRAVALVVATFVLVLLGRGCQVDERLDEAEIEVAAKRAAKAEIKKPRPEEAEPKFEPVPVFQVKTMHETLPRNEWETTPWRNARVGDWTIGRVTGFPSVNKTVLKEIGDHVIVYEMFTSYAGNNLKIVSTMDFSGPEMKPNPADKETEEVLTIAGKKVKAIRKDFLRDGVVHQYWHSKDVPGGLIRTAVDSRILLEVTDFGFK